MPAPTQVDPATRAKALKTTALSVAIGGIGVGVGFPVLLVVQDIEVVKTDWGFDYAWLASTVVMIVDFVLAWFFWRRGDALDPSFKGCRRGPDQFTRFSTTIIQILPGALARWPRPSTG